MASKLLLVTYDPFAKLSGSYLLWFLHLTGCTANDQSTITMAGDNGTIPKTSGWLPLNATCQWNITANVNNVLRIYITVSFQKPCSDNHLKIHDGPSDSSDIIAEFNCNSTPVNGIYFFSSGRSLWLEVKTGITENSTTMHVAYVAQEKQGKSIWPRDISLPSLSRWKELKCSYNGLLEIKISL